MDAPIAPLSPPRRLLMGSGPSNPDPRVLAALARRPLAPDDPALRSVLADIMAASRRVFQTSNACTLAVPGASRSGIEAVLAGLIEPGDRVLVGVYGHFGELLCDLASRHGAVVDRVEAEWGAIIDPEAVIRAMRRRSPKVVAIVQADTSTGMLQPLNEIGRACRAAGSLLVVDAVLSLGGCELSVDAWCLDAAIGGMQKCLGGPPGLAPLTYSERARAAMAGRRVPPRSAYLDLSRLAAAWLEASQAPEEAMPRSVSVSMLFALHEALRVVEEEGLVTRWERHRRAGRAVAAGLVAMGLELFGDRAHAAPMIALARVPEGVSEVTVREQLLLEHGIEIMAAFGPLRGRVWRIGTMGYNARLEAVLGVLGALEAVLSAHGMRLPPRAAIEAARAAYGSGMC